MFSKFKSVAHLGSSHDAQPGSREQSLVTILTTAEQREDLLLLVIDSTEAMRGRILDVFDAEKTGYSSSLKLKAQPPTPLASDTSGDVIATKVENDTANEKDVQNSSGDASESRRKKYERRVKDISGPAMSDLKKAAIEHFDEWRDRVISRVGEAINQHLNEEESEPVKPHDRGAATTEYSEQNSLPSVAEDTEADKALLQLYPPHKTTLSKLDKPRRVLILHSILLLLLSLERYEAESRILMLHITSSLSLPLQILAADESQVAQDLLEASKQQMNADKETKDKENASALSRNLKVGLGAAAGAVLIGVTGGLAAPLLAAGVGTVMGGLGLGATATAGYLGALAGSAPLVGILFGAYGGRMTGEMIDEYAKEVQDFAFIPLRKQHAFGFGKGKGRGEEKNNARHLRVSIGISGYLTEESEVLSPWQVTSNASAESFALRWELEALVKLGHALTIYVKSYAWGFAKKQIISRTIFAALSSALALPYGIAKASRVVDNPFSVARSRSEKAGKVLADALVNKVQGERPVTLMGYSLGARVIFYCLKELADRRAFGLVESVILIGAVTPSDSLDWRNLRSVVSGRLVNVYSTKDYLLGFLYRASSLQYGIAGLGPIDGVEGVENVDVSDLVDGHTKYRFLIGKILQRVGWEDVDAQVVEKQMAKFVKQEQEQAEDDKVQDKAEGDDVAAAEAEEMEKEVEQKSKASLAMDWFGSKLSDLGLAQSDKRAKADEANITEEEKLKRAGL